MLPQPRSNVCKDVHQWRIPVPMQFLIPMALLLPCDIAPGDGTPQVTLGPPAGDVDTGSVPALLKVASEAHNGLGWPVDSITMGVLYATDRRSLGSADPSRLYAAPPTTPGAVGAVVQRVAVALPGRGSAMTLLRTSLPAGTPTPTIFLSHVLGYTLADVDGATLLQLLDTSAAADEWAACAAFGLMGPGPQARRQARARWAHHRSLTGDLAASLLRPVDAKPSQRDAFQRVFAALALGVLGGPTAEDTLATWRESPDLNRFDSPLQVLRVGRASGTPFETPLAWAVPESVLRMRDVVDVALDDVRHLDARGMALPEGGLHAPPVTDPDPPWWTLPVAWAFLLGGLCTGAAVAFRLRHML